MDFFFKNVQRVEAKKKLDGNYPVSAWFSHSHLDQDSVRMRLNNQLYYHSFNSI